MSLAAAQPLLLVLVESARLSQHSIYYPLLSTFATCLFILLLSVLPSSIESIIRHCNQIQSLRRRLECCTYKNISSTQSTLNDFVREDETESEPSLGVKNHNGEWILIIKVITAMNVWILAENMAFTQLPTIGILIIKSFLPSFLSLISPVQPLILHATLMTIPSVSFALMAYTMSKEIVIQYTGSAILFAVTSTLAQALTFLFIDELINLKSHDLWDSLMQTRVLHYSTLTFFGVAILAESASITFKVTVVLKLLSNSLLMAVSIKLFSGLALKSSPLHLSLIYSGALIIAMSEYTVTKTMVGSIVYPLGIMGSLLALFVLSKHFATSTYSRKLLPVINATQKNIMIDRKSAPLTIRFLVGGFYAILLIIILISSSSSSVSPTHTSNSLLKPYVSLPNTHELRSHNVSAVIFYGRRESVRILNCYLERNLAKNGGILSEVIFVVKTDKIWDLDFLDYLIERNQPYYRKVEIAKKGWDFSSHYSWMTPNTLYFKIDDDIIYIRDGTFEEMLSEKLSDRYLFLSANVINHPILAPLHGSLGAIAPYQPSPEQTDPWVRSSDPAYLNGDDFDLRTCAWKNWKCAMLSHENFLYNMEHNMSSAYEFSIYDFHAYDANLRWSINFIVMNSSDTVITMADDEKEIAVEIPRKLRRHCAAVGKALVVHYAYNTQRTQLNEQKHILSRYADLAVRECGFVLTGEEKANRTVTGRDDKMRP